MTTTLNEWAGQRKYRDIEDAAVRLRDMMDEQGH